MKKLLKLLLVFILVGCHTGTKKKEQKSGTLGQENLIGFYEYRAGKGGKNQYILIDTLNHKFYGIYYRMEPKRTKGPWYSAHSLKELEVSDSLLSFSLGTQSLYSIKKVPPGLNTNKLTGSSEPNAVRSLSFNGKIMDNTLQLECNSSSEECLTGNMTFTKIPLTD